MKRCPSCQRTYPDDAPAFCVSDGTRLIDEPSAPAYDPQKTIMASAPPPQPYSNPSPLPNNPPSPPTQQQAAWPPPPPQQQGQNWGGGYYPQGQGYAPPKSKSLALATLIIGCISGLLGAFLLLDYLHVIRMLTRDTAIPMLIAAIATGIIALVLGLITLFSSRQRGKGMAAVGMILGAFSIGFWIYLEVEHGIFFR
ncbi:MAG: hypothetical protein QOH63_1575 [Acidobacteriota bacterium]|jgi:hypothetical protein|nr:hypothetical protein [Acidobacteriota bacterium]